MPGIEGKQNMARMLDRLRQVAAAADRRPAGHAASRICCDEDGWMGPFKGGHRSRRPQFPDLSPGRHGPLALRPSGTEPKAKIYIETCSPPRTPDTTDAEWAQSCAAIDKLAERLEKEFTLLATGLVG